MTTRIWFVEDHPPEIEPLLKYLRKQGFLCEVLPWSQTTRDRFANATQPERDLFLFVDAVIDGRNIAETILTSVRNSPSLRDVPIALLTAYVPPAEIDRYRSYRVLLIYSKEGLILTQTRGKPKVNEEWAKSLAGWIRTKLVESTEAWRRFDEAIAAEQCGDYCKAVELYERYLECVGQTGQDDVHSRLMRGLAKALSDTSGDFLLSPHREARSAATTSLLEKLKADSERAYEATKDGRADIRAESVKYWLAATWHLDKSLEAEFPRIARRVFDQVPAVGTVAEEVLDAIDRFHGQLDPRALTDLLVPDSLRDQLRLVEALSHRDEIRTQEVAMHVAKRMMAREPSEVLGDLRRLGKEMWPRLLSSLPLTDLRTWRGVIELAAAQSPEIAYDLWVRSREAAPDTLGQPEWVTLSLDLYDSLTDPSMRAHVVRDLLQRDLQLETFLERTVEAAGSLDGGSEILKENALNIVRQCRNKGWWDLLRRFQDVCEERLRAFGVGRARIYAAHLFGEAFSEAGEIRLKPVGGKFFAAEVGTRLNPQYFRSLTPGEQAENFDTCRSLVENRVLPYDRRQAEAFLDELRARERLPVGAERWEFPPEGAGETEESAIKTVADAVRRASMELSSPLVFLDSAISSAMDSPFKDAPKVYRFFEALWLVASEWRDNGGRLGTTWAKAMERHRFPDVREHISQTAEGKWGEEYRFLYKGTKRLFEKHVTFGAKQADKCLSIHWYCDEVDLVLVIGHCGRHLTNTST